MKFLFAAVFFACALVSSGLAQTAPTIASISSSQRRNQGESLSLSVSVNGTAPFSYVWKKGGTAITGATASVYVIDALGTNDTGSYTVTVTNTAGAVTSGAILIDVVAAVAPTLNYNSSSQTYTVGDTISLYASVSGTSPITYVWKKDGTPLAGATSSSYSKGSATAQDAGTYSFTATNVAGSVTSGSILVTINPASAPTFGGSPYDTSVSVGSYFQLYAYTNSSTTVTYQWYKDNVAIVGATSYVYIKTSAIAADSGEYKVIATNSAGSTTSRTATVTVNPATPPTSLSISSGPITITTGESLSLYASVGGTSPFSFQWRKDGADIPGATSSSYYKSVVTSADAGSYSVVATNTAGSATSSSTTVSITSAQAPVITSHPSSLAVYPGDYVNLSVSAAGTGSLSYQWRKDGVNMPNATSYYLSVTSSAVDSDAAVYSVVVGNAQGSVTSQPARLIVLPAEAPVIVSQPSGQNVAPGESVALSVVATGRPLPTYQWKKDGIAIPSQTYSSFSKYAVASSDTGSYTVTVTNSAGSVTSQVADVTVAAPVGPGIFEHPASYSLLLGEYASLSINHSVSSGATVQWYRDNVAIEGATSTYYSINNAQPSHAGSYKAVVTANGESVTSYEGTVTVDLSATRPLITYTSGSRSVPGDEYASVQVSVAPSVTNYTVVWKKDGVVVPNATSLYLSFSSFSTSLAGTYTAEVTAGGSTATSRPIVLSLRDAGAAPTIVSQPAAVVRSSGSSYADFYVSARGERPLSYQWKKDGVDIPNARNPYYSLSSLTSAMAGNYTVVVSNVNGSVTSSTASLTVLSAAAAGLPVISQHPVSRTVTLANTSYVSLSVSVIQSSSGLTFQWYKDGIAIPSATSSYYYGGTLSAQSAGRYKVTVTNSAGTVTSEEAILSVTSRVTGPTFTTQPGDQTGYTGGTVTFSAAATGSSTVTYQWRKNGVNISGATGATLTLSNLQSSDVATYSVLATDNAGSTGSTVAKLTLLPSVAPTITTQPASQLGWRTGTASFTVAATGTPAPSYQWKKNGVDVSGANGTTLSFNNLSAGDAGNYAVVVSNLAGSVTSNSAMLTVYDEAPVAPVFTTHPQGRTYTPGETVTLTVTVTGSPAPSLQWYKNDAAIGGANGTSLALGAASASLAGKYHAVASNALGTVSSNPATIGYNASQYAGTYTGTLSSGEKWALVVHADGTGTFLGMVTSTGNIIFEENFTVSPNGEFSFGSTASSTARGSSADGAGTGTAGSRYFAGAVSGRISGNAVTGQVGGANRTLAGTAVTGSATAGVAGVYEGIPLGSSLGEVHAIAAPDGTVLLIAVDASGVRGATGTVTASGAFTVSDPAFSYTGNLSSNNGSLSGTYQPAGAPPVVIGRAPSTGQGLERLINVAARGVAGKGANTLIAGFVVTGSSKQSVMIRAVGPTLTTLGVQGAVANPRLHLYQGATLILENDNWSVGGYGTEIAAASSRLGGYPLPAGSADAAIIANLDPGAYSAHITTADTSTGVAMLEVYDAATSASTAAKVVNLSARGAVGRGDDIMIVGFVVSGDVPKKVLVRGVGPALTPLGVDGALADPKLQLFTGSTAITDNDNWSAGADATLIADAARACGASPLSAGSKDAAILVYLAPGAYSAHVRGVGDTTGVALVEVYEVP